MTLRVRPTQLRGTVPIVLLSAFLLVLPATHRFAPSATGAPLPTALRINAGGPALTDSDGNLWSADVGYAGGDTYATPHAIAGTGEAAVFRSERFGMTSYTLHVANGTYSLRLLEAEIWFTAAGKRVFSIAANGSIIDRDVDIFARVGADAPLWLVHDVTVTDQTLTLTFTASVNHAKVDGIVLLPSSDPTPAPTASPRPTATPRPTSIPAPPAAPPTTCGLSAVLVPTCPGALWGFYSAGNSMPQDASMESTTGRTFEIEKQYHDFSNSGANGRFPSVAEIAAVRSGHILHIAWSSDIWSGRPGPGMPTPAIPATGSSHAAYTYAQILNGSLDTYIAAEADRIKQLPTKLFLDFQHEADGAAAQRLGTDAQFAASYRHVEDIFRAHHVTNVVWAWVVAGFRATQPGATAVYAALYPGDSYVDWIGWDPYNNSSSHWRSPDQTFAAFNTFLDTGFLGAAATAKPRMLGEYGSIADPANPSRRGLWMAAIPSALESLPRIRAVEYFDSGSWGYFDNDPAAVQGFTTAGQSPSLRYLRPS